MKYVYTDSQGTHFDHYFEYVKSLRSKLPLHVFRFASNPEHYSLTSHASLHDAWLERYEVREPAEGERKQYRQTELQVCLLGPYHDRRIFLEYGEVQTYSVSSSNSASGHGDLLVHEVRLEETGLLVHELQFVNGNMVVQCKDIRHRQEPYENA